VWNTAQFVKLVTVQASSWVGRNFGHFIRWAISQTGCNVYSSFYYVACITRVRIAFSSKIRHSTGMAQCIALLFWNLFSWWSGLTNCPSPPPAGYTLGCRLSRCCLKTVWTLWRAELSPKKLYRVPKHCLGLDSKFEQTTTPDLFPLKVGWVRPKRGCLLTLAYYAFPRWYEFGERRWNDIDR
jgi:hypothetical protein